MLPIAQELADRGHIITIATKDIVRDSSPKIPNAKYVTLYPTEAEDPKEYAQTVESFNKSPDFLMPLFNLGFAKFNIPTKDPKGDYALIIDYINSLKPEEKPDLFLLDYYALSALDAADTLGIPTSLSFAFGPELFSPNGISAFPKGYLPFPSRNMTFEQTMVNVVLQKIGLHLIGLRIWGFRRYLTHKLPIITSFDQLSQDRLILMHTVPEFSPSEPLPDRFVYLGASSFTESMKTELFDLMAAKKPALIGENESINNWLDEKKSSGISVVYVGFGSVWTPTQEQLLSIIDGLVTPERAVLISLKTHLHGHISNSTLPESLLRTNLFAANWVQQKEVLAHPAVKVFFTHGGINSVIESMVAGVPFLCRPLMSDQPYCCRRIVDLQMGLEISRHQQISNVIVKEAIEDVEKNYENFKMNTVRMGKVFYSAGGAQKAADKIESYFLGDGPDGWKSSHLSSYQLNANFISQTITVLCVLGFVVWVLLCSTCFWFLFLRKKPVVVKEKSH